MTKNEAFEILEIKADSSAEEIRAAYLKLAKKYHPDRYENNPLKDLAEEKLREVNEAYDLLKGGASSSSGAGGGGGSSAYSGADISSENSRTVRMAIDRNNLGQAEEVLSAEQNRGAEWNFLWGNLCLRKGMFHDAVNHINQAVAMAPNNMEYRNAQNQIQMRSNGFANAGFQNGYGGAERQLCQCLQCYCCAEMCCN